MRPVSQSLHGRTGVLSRQAGSAASAFVSFLIPLRKQWQFKLLAAHLDHNQVAVLPVFDNVRLAGGAVIRADPFAPEGTLVKYMVIELAVQLVDPVKLEAAAGGRNSQSFPGVTGWIELRREER